MMIASLEALDKAWTLAINSLNCPFTDSLWMMFSNKTVWIPLYLAVAAALIWRLGWKRGLLMILAAALCILCVDQTANLFKTGVARLRPCNDPWMVENGLHMLAKPSARSCYGFFSAHAGNSIAFAVITIIGFSLDKKPSRKIDYRKVYGIAVIIWALMVGVSRIFVGKHFLGDVLVGFIIGSAIALIIGKLFCLIARKIK